MIDLLSWKMDNSLIEALLTGPATEEWNELKAESLALEENLADANSDRTQLLKAVQFAVDFLPETSHNLKVQAKLEMALTDLLIPIPQKEESSD